MVSSTYLVFFSDLKSTLVLVRLSPEDQLSEEICLKFSTGVQVKHSNLEGASRKTIVMLSKDFGQ